MSMRWPSGAFHPFRSVSHKRFSSSQSSRFLALISSSSSLSLAFLLRTTNQSKFVQIFFWKNRNDVLFFLPSSSPSVGQHLLHFDLTFGNPSKISSVLDRLKFASSHEWVKHEGAVATTAESMHHPLQIPLRQSPPTPTELSWIVLLYNSTPSFKKRAEFDASVLDAPTRAEKFAQRLECHHFLKPSVLKRVKSALLTKAKQRIASTYGNKSG